MMTDNQLTQHDASSSSKPQKQAAHLDDKSDDVDLKKSLLAEKVAKVDLGKYDDDDDHMDVDPGVPGVSDVSVEANNSKKNEKQKQQNDNEEEDSLDLGDDDEDQQQQRQLVVKNPAGKSLFIVDEAEEDNDADEEAPVGDLVMRRPPTQRAVETQMKGLLAVGQRRGRSIAAAMNERALRSVLLPYTRGQPTCSGPSDGTGCPTSEPLIHQQTLSRGSCSRCFRTDQRREEAAARRAMVIEIQRGSNDGFQAEHQRLRERRRLLQARKAAKAQAATLARRVAEENAKLSALEAELTKQ